MSFHQNKINILANIPSKIYFALPKKASFHNLCSTTSVPPGTNHLLGLGHKFIPHRSHAPIENDLDKSIKAFERDARIRHFFEDRQNKYDDEDDNVTTTSNENEYTCPTRLYIKSKWDPPLGNEILELKLRNFAQHLRQHITNQRIKNTPNLNKLQRHAMQSLKKSPNLIVLLADKNLGPVVMERTTYIDRVLSDHLNDTSTYQKIEKFSALSAINNLREKLKRLFLPHPHNKVHTTNEYNTPQHHEDRKNLHDYERHFLGTNLHDTSQRIPIFYGLVKVHKTPWKIRPVVSCSGSLLASVSTWIDSRLQRYKKHIVSYVKDSDELQHQLSTLKLPMDKILLGTSDAVSMYTNIETKHNIYTVDKWLDKIATHLPSEFPKTILLEAIKIVMENNIFQFGNKYFIQKSGTAMGTPCACILATIYFSLHEEYLLSPYQKYILFYKRFIDDCFYIWRSNGDSTSAFQQYEKFKAELDHYGLLRWTHTPLSNRTNFLDLTITYESIPHRLTFRTYQKKENLYLYITPHSAHPPGILKSLVYGLLRKYKIQNTYIEDFNNMVSKLFSRLLARGHKPTTLARLFQHALHSLPGNPNEDSLPNKENKVTTKGKTLFFKTKYHQSSLPRSLIQNIFHDTCNTSLSDQKILNNESDKKDVLKNMKLTIAFSREKNLRDILIPSKLHSTKNK